MLLWDELCNRGCPLVKGRTDVLDADRKAKAPRCTFWISSKRAPRLVNTIFIGAGTGTVQEYYKAWEQALDDVVEDSIAAFKAHNAKVGKKDLKGRYFSFPAGWTGRFTVFLAPQGDWLQPAALVVLARTKAVGQPVDFVALPLLGTLTADQITNTTTLDNKTMEKLGQKLTTVNEMYKKGDKLVKISTNPLNLYTTWVRASDLNTLISAQTGGANSWVCEIPNAPQVYAQNQTLVNNGLFARDLVIRQEETILPLRPRDPLPIRKRENTKTFMGDSANQVPCPLICSTRRR